MLQMATDYCRLEKKNVGLISEFLSLSLNLASHLSSMFSLCLQNALQKTSIAHIHPPDIDVLMIASKLVSIFGKIQVPRIG